MGVDFVEILMETENHPEIDTDRGFFREKIFFEQGTQYPDFIVQYPSDQLTLTRTR